MQNKLISFARQHQLNLAEEQAAKLLSYAKRVLEKKSQLNLTGAATLEEVVHRHLCDGLIGAAQIARLAHRAGQEIFTLLDAGSGAGFIGLTLAAVFPQANVLLAESLAKRCMFLNWVVLQEKFTNVTVKNVRLGQQPLPQADYVIERAMGQLPDILALCLAVTKPGGVFLAYQGAAPQTIDPTPYGAAWEDTVTYQLTQDKAPKHLVLCRKAL